MKYLKKRISKRFMAAVLAMAICVTGLMTYKFSSHASESGRGNTVDMSGETYTYNGIKFMVLDIDGDDALIVDGKEFNKAKLNLEALPFTNEYSSLAETLLGKNYVWKAYTKRIGKKAFKGNDHIKKIEGNFIRLEKIENGAFQDMKNLKEIDLSYTLLKSIGKEAFAGDKKLKTVRLDMRNLKSIGKDAFKGTPSGIKFIVYGEDYEDYDDLNAAIKAEKKELRKAKKRLGKLLKNSGAKDPVIVSYLD